MTMQHFGTFALWIPDAWSWWRIGATEYRRLEDGAIGWRPVGTNGRWRRGDVQAVDTILPARRRTAVA